MASIIAENVSLVFPLVGSDRRFGVSFTSRARQPGTQIGGQIMTDDRGAVAIRAIDDFNVSLKDGDRLGIFGHNGAGKSSLLRLLAGIYPPTTGSIRISGHTAGMFSLSMGINKEATGYDNIIIKGLMYGLRKQEIVDLVPEIAAFSELGDYLYMPVKVYSSGMVMRLMFSIANAVKPDILLLDEWISSGDRTFKRKVDERLEQMLDVTPIVVIASHNENRIRQWSTKAIRLNKGKASVED